VAELASLYLIVIDEHLEGSTWKESGGRICNHVTSSFAHLTITIGWNGIDLWRGIEAFTQEIDISL
jgi:hypothetical protein